MDLEQIKLDKTKEAEELFKQIGIDPKQHTTLDLLQYLPQKSTPNDSDKTTIKFHWTRLSINSNFGCIVE